MAPPLFAISFYAGCFDSEEKAGYNRWNPSFGGLHLDFWTPPSSNSYNATAYHAAILNPRFPEAIQVLDDAWHLSAYFTSQPSTRDDQRFQDPAFAVGRGLLWAADPANPAHSDLNPHNIHDPVEWLYDAGWWVRGGTPGWVEGYDPDRGRVAGYRYQPSTAPYVPPGDDEVRTVCGRQISKRQMIAELSAQSYPGPWTWDAMIAAFRRANPTICGTSTNEVLACPTGQIRTKAGKCVDQMSVDGMLAYVERNQGTLILAAVGILGAKMLLGGGR